MIVATFTAAYYFVILVPRLSESRDTGINVKLLHTLADKVYIHSQSRVFVRFTSRSTRFVR